MADPHARTTGDSLAATQDEQERNWWTKQLGHAPTLPEDERQGTAEARPAELAPRPQPVLRVIPIAESHLERSEPSQPDPDADPAALFAQRCWAVVLDSAPPAAPSEDKPAPAP
jgi:hypothetical protein